jgi:hypothetical protein
MGKKRVSVDPESGAEFDLSGHPAGTSVRWVWANGTRRPLISIPAEPRPHNIGDPRSPVEKKRAAARLGGQLKTAEQCARMVTPTTEAGFEVRDPRSGALL